MSRDRVLVFNFFGGVLERGIPLYARDIKECIKRIGMEPFELRCPAWLQRAPRPILNLLFVVFEQFAAPAVRCILKCRSCIYPYNSTSIIDALLGRAVLVVHDVLPNRRQNTALAARYIRVTQAVHTALSRPVCAASERTLTHLSRLASFRHCPLALWSNPFYSFEAAVARQSSAARSRQKRLRVLLCSGIGANKDYAGALTLFRHSSKLQNAELRIVGFGHDAHLADRRVRRLPPSVGKRIRVLPRLTLDELAGEYLSSDLVWIHSKSEGFGRPIVEARLCSKPVIASKIGAFRSFEALGIRLYDEDRFDEIVQAALNDKNTPATGPDVDTYHNQLERAATSVLRRLHQGRY